MPPPTPHCTSTAGQPAGRLARVPASPPSLTLPLLSPPLPSPALLLLGPSCRPSHPPARPAGVWRHHGAAGRGGPGRPQHRPGDGRAGAWQRWRRHCVLLVAVLLLLVAVLLVVVHVFVRVWSSQAAPAPATLGGRGAAAPLRACPLARARMPRLHHHHLAQVPPIQGCPPSLCVPRPGLLQHALPCRCCFRCAPRRAPPPHVAPGTPVTNRRHDGYRYFKGTVSSR